MCVPPPAASFFFFLGMRQGRLSRARARARAFGRGRGVRGACAWCCEKGRTPQQRPAPRDRPHAHPPGQWPIARTTDWCSIQGGCGAAGARGGWARASGRRAISTPRPAVVKKKRQLPTNVVSGQGVVCAPHAPHPGRPPPALPRPMHPHRCFARSPSYPHAPVVSKPRGQPADAAPSRAASARMAVERRGMAFFLLLLSFV